MLKVAAKFLVAEDCLGKSEDSFVSLKARAAGIIKALRLDKLVV